MTFSDFPTTLKPSATFETETPVTCRTFCCESKLLKCKKIKNAKIVSTSSLKERILTVHSYGQLGRVIVFFFAFPYRAAKIIVYHLKSVANAQNGNTSCKDILVVRQSILGVH